jgi:uncharacterized protein (TIGR02271 family)
MAATVIGMFDSESEARSAAKDLIAMGIASGDIHMSSKAEGGATNSESNSPSFWQELKDIFTGDGESQHVDYYAEGSRRGGTVLTVTASDERADSAADILRAHHAVDINDRAAQWSQSGWSGYRADASTSAACATTNSPSTETANQTSDDRAQDKMSVPVVEEALEVGKRRVQGGGVRIIRRVTERPVQEDISLREERVNVERRPVDRDLTSADLENAFTDKTVEVTETSEVPVAAKTAKVVEEVVVNKDVQQRTETVRDSVRRSDVEVERLPGQDASGSTSKSTESEPQTSQRTRTRQD